MNEAPEYRASLPRILFWGCAVGLATLFAAGGVWAIQHGYGDWHAMSDASGRVGTPALLHPPERWQVFAYLPATAYLFAPLGVLPMRAGFIANALVMTACAAAAGVVAARVFGLPRGTAAGLFLTWPPVVYAAAIMGQNASFGLLLTMLSISGTAAKSPLLTALPLGVLLYKPTYAVPLIGVLVIRRAWRELTIVGGCAVGWYLASVVATGGDWSWPAAWYRVVAAYAPGDLAFNGPLGVSAATTLVRMGAPSALIVVSLVCVAAVAVLAVRRSGSVEAATGATLLALAWSPHAWAYDGALALPMIAFAMAKLTPAARTPVLFALYAIAGSFVLSRSLGFDPLLIVTVGGSSLWLLQVLLRQPTHRNDPVSPAATVRV